MAIQSALCTSFRQEILSGVHDVLNDDLRIALFDADSGLNTQTTEYTTSNEVVGPGYDAGGLLLTGKNIVVDNDVVVLDFDDPQWFAASFTARVALVYNASKANRAIAVIDLQFNRTGTGGAFTLVLPPPTSTAGLIRLR